MRAVIISGGSIADCDYIIKHVNAEDTVICADSGYNHAIKMGIRPHAVVGDFDSIEEMPKGVTTLRFPAKKDFTDTEIAIDYARGQGFKDFLLIGATGSRMDHTLTNILLLKGFIAQGETAVIVDRHNRIMLTDSQVDLRGKAGDIVSLVPIEDCRGVCTTGLEYPLFEADLFVGKGLGVSNVMAQGVAHVSISKGLLLVIIARD